MRPDEPVTRIDFTPLMSDAESSLTCRQNGNRHCGLKWNRPPFRSFRDAEDRNGAPVLEGRCRGIAQCFPRHPGKLCQEPVPCCSRPPDTYSSSGKPSYGLQEAVRLASGKQANLSTGRL